MHRIARACCLSPRKSAVKVVFTEHSAAVGGESVWLVWVMLRLDFLTHATQGLEEPQQTPRFVLTAAVALELSEALKKHAQLALQGSLGAGQDRH